MGWDGLGCDDLVGFVVVGNRRSVRRRVLVRCINARYRVESSTTHHDGMTYYHNRLSA